MQNVRSSQSANSTIVADFDRRRDLLFLTVLGPFGLVSVAAFFASASFVDHATRTIFLLAPIVTGGAWLAYEQMHDLVWWSIRPFCPQCHKSYHIWPRPRPGAVCDCCDKPLYPIQTPQDFKVIVLITVITVVALPVLAVWASLVARLG